MSSKRSQSGIVVKSSFSPSYRRFTHRAALTAFLAGTALTQAQTWTRLGHNPPAAVNLMLLLTDGTVMAANNNGQSIGRNWYKLTPDAHGSYVNGTWMPLAAAHDTRLYFSSQVLQDGRVFIAGGEYGTGGAKAEVYNPDTNTWMALNVPTSVLDPSATSPATGGNQTFFDSISTLLSNGSVLISPVGPRVSRGTVLFDSITNTFSNGPLLFRGVYQDEASWVKLPDGSILTIDPFGTNSERFIPSTNTWINDSNVPVSLYDPFGGELGAAFLLPNGKAFFLGATGHTALYTPSGSNSPGSWAAGPDIPGGMGTPDAPAAMMANGHILCSVSAAPTSGNHFPSPASFVEYDPVSNSFSSVPGPTGSTLNGPTYVTCMLDLPDGNVLFSHMATDVYTYTPSGAPLAAGKPVVTSVLPNPDGTFHLTGMNLNGISEGAAYGDDFQMPTNYPLVRLSDQSGNVYYAKTYNWTSAGVMTGSREVSVEYKLPTGLPQGQYTMVVVTNGIASDPFTDSPISISLPDGAPTLVPGGVPTDIAVRVTPAAQQIQGSPQFLYRMSSSGPFTSVPLTPLGNNDYRATLPAPQCADHPEFYFLANGDQGATVTLPHDAPMTTYHAGVGTLVTRFTDDFEVDHGWSGAADDDTATTGRWTRNLSQMTAAQPQGNHTPTGVMCWVTDYRAGTQVSDYDVDDGKTTLMSPRLDMSNLPMATISYWRWYSNGVGLVNPHTNTFTVDVSNDDGNSWYNAETVGPNGPETNGGWYQHSFVVSDLLPLTSMMRIRFVASDYTGSIVEAAVDDFSLTGITCSAPSCYANCDHSVTPPILNVNDFICFQTKFSAGDPYANCDGSTIDPVLNVNDFLCFQSRFSAGCSAP